MRNNASDTYDRGPGPGSRLRRIGLLAPAVMAIGLFAAGCSSGSASPGVASAGSASPTSSTGTTGTHASALAFAQCMRSHGIKDFPDPNSSGQLQIQSKTGSGGINPSSQQFQAAQQACNSLMPGAGSPAQQAKNHVNAVKFASCMRSHGITAFPDPNSLGGFQIKAGPGLNPNSPQYQSAQKACQRYMRLAPPLPGPGGSS